MKSKDSRTLDQPFNSCLSREAMAGLRFVEHELIISRISMLNFLEDNS